MTAVNSPWRPPPDIDDADLLVVAMTDHYFEDGFVADFTLPATWGLDLSCRFTNDRALAVDADALWYHAPCLSEVPRRLRRGQRLILASMESDVNYPILAHPRALAHFDLLMTYRLDSDIPMPYANRRQYPGLAEPRMPSTGPMAAAPALFLASSEEPKRDHIVRRLMDHVAVDSPGKCLNNCDIPEFHSRFEDPLQVAADVFRRYRFLLAFENSRTRDYVTEKAYRALAVGIVPVYLGAPNFREFMPADHAAIGVEDFDTVEALGAYLNHLVSNPSAYAAHHLWRRQPPGEAFARLLDLGNVDCRYRMALKIAHGCGPHCACGGRLRATRWP